MSIERAIHERWAASPALSALLDAQRVTTGRRPGAAAAVCATIERTAARSLLPTNAGHGVEEIALRVTIRHEDYDAGHAILAAAAEALDGAVLALDAGARHARLRQIAQTPVQQPHAPWLFHLDLSARICPL
ncbi:MAG: hypothetical protein JW809_17095 [Pirellulales bacterium]|nr:hypothetical protein [Pirellulales bacterium]